MSTSLQRPAMQSRRDWNKALCNTDGGQRTKASSHCRVVQQENNRSTCSLPLLKCLQSPYIHKAKTTILVCLLLHNVFLRATYLLSYYFFFHYHSTGKINPQKYILVPFNLSDSYLQFWRLVILSAGTSLIYRYGKIFQIESLLLFERIMRNYCSNEIFFGHWD